MKIGIWIDSDQAYIVDHVHDNIMRLESGIDHFNVKGGSRAKTPYGPQQVVSESKMLEKKKHQFKDFFENIGKLIHGSEEIAVFGPASTKNEFANWAEESHEYRGKVVGVNTADSMTENQMKALVRDFYSNQ